MSEDKEPENEVAHADITRLKVIVQAEIAHHPVGVGAGENEEGPMAIFRQLDEIFRLLYDDENPVVELRRGARV